MRFLSSFLISAGLLLLNPSFVFAQTNEKAASFANQSITTLIILASLSAVIFLIRGGFQYITSTGKPEALAQAKQTIRNALIGIVLVIGAGVFSSILQTAFVTPNTPGSTESFKLTPIQPVEPAEGLTQVLIDAVTGFLQAIIQSATKPIIDGVISFLTITPSLTQNSVIFNFWLVIVGIVDSLFILLVALLGFQVMSASTFEFDEIELKQLLPRIGFSFLLTNMSIFLIDWVLSLCNMLITVVLDSTGGIGGAWVLNAFDPQAIGARGEGTAIITLIFMILFIILAVVLLLFYISRLITISVGAVLSPFIFLLWMLPGFTDFAIVAARSYLVLIFTVFIHVVIIQLASSFLTLPGQSGTNTVISILVGIATLLTLLRAPGMMMQFAFFSASGNAMRKLGGQIIHVVSSQQNQTHAPSREEPVTKRRTVAL